MFQNLLLQSALATRRKYEATSARTSDRRRLRSMDVQQLLMHQSTDQQQQQSNRQQPANADGASFASAHAEQLAALQRFFLASLSASGAGGVGGDGATSAAELMLASQLWPTLKPDVEHSPPPPPSASTTKKAAADLSTFAIDSLVAATVAGANANASSNVATIDSSTRPPFAVIKVEEANGDAIAAHNETTAGS